MRIIPSKKRPSKKKKALGEELTLKEQKDLAIFAIVIVVSTILAGVFAPQFGALARQEKWLDLIILAVVLTIFVFVLLVFFVAVMKRRLKRKRGLGHTSRFNYVG